MEPVFSVATTLRCLNYYKGVVASYQAALS